MTRRTIAIWAAVMLAAARLHAEQPTDVKAFFRDGQTFITWREDAAAQGESYRVYRSDRPITAAGLARARMILEVREGSCKFREMFQKDGRSLLVNRKKQTPPWVIPRLCVQPAGDDGRPSMLPEGTGLLVWTVKEKERRSYYAVTTVSGGREDKAVTAANSCGPVAEKKEPVGAVRYHVQQTGKRGPRDWYIMYMDPELWNVDYIGYAFPFGLMRTYFKEGGKMPTAHLDGIGTMNAFAAGYAAYGSGDFSRNALPTWYYGYGTKVKDRASGINVKQPVANYVQYRFMQSVLFARRKYRITRPQFHIQGNSMGASGVIGLAMAYPKFITSIWSNQGMTDYGNTYGSGNRSKIVLWKSSIWGNYGDPKLGNPAKLLPFGDERLDWYLKHDGMNVYDFRNAAKFLAANVGTSFPLLLIGHTHGDGSIPARNQAYPFEKYIRDSRHTFAYSIKDGGHGWGSAFNGSRMRDHVWWDESRPGFSNVPCIKTFQYGKFLQTSRTYCAKVGWASRSRKIKGASQSETGTSWRMPLVNDAKPGEDPDYFVDITPRNLQKLEVSKGYTFAFRVLDIGGAPLRIADFGEYEGGADAKARFKAAGEITADEHGLLLVPCVPIRKAGCIVEVRLKSRARR